MLRVETSPPCHPALDKKEQDMDAGDDPNHTTECFGSTLSSMWCHLARGHAWISILVVLLNTLADRQHLGSSSAITSSRRRFCLFMHFKSFLYQGEGLNHSAGPSAVEFSLLKRCPPVSHPPSGANNEMTVAAITNVP